MSNWTLKFDDTVENIIRDIGTKHWHYIYTKPSQFKEELAASLTDDEYADTLRFLNLLIDKKASKDMALVRDCGKSYITLELASIAHRISGETFIDSSLIASGLCVFVAGLGKSINAADVKKAIKKIDSHVAREKDIDQKVDKDKNSALIFSTRNGALSEVKSLLSRGANINYQNKYKDTALNNACERGYNKIVRLLLDEGAEFQSENFADTGWSALMYATRNAHIECMKMLMDAGADIEYKNELGRTCLMLAAFMGHIECVKLLIEAGADVAYKNSTKESAISYAELYKYDALQEKVMLFIQMIKYLKNNMRKYRKKKPKVKHSSKHVENFKIAGEKV